MEWMDIMKTMDLRTVDNICWELWQPPEEAHMWVYDINLPLPEHIGLMVEERPMTKVEFNKVISSKPILLRVPTSQDQARQQIIKIDNVPITCYKLLCEIHQFYMTPITKYDIYVDDDSSYAEDARKKIKEGEILIKFDLLGSRKRTYDESSGKEVLVIDGAIHFNGLEKLGRNLYQLHLGN